MHILFVCTGNVCRSPMGELMMRRYLVHTSIEISSAGTHGLDAQPIDPSSRRLMDSLSIDSSSFRSKQLTREMAESADLVLCFEHDQVQDVVSIAPGAIRHTFLITEFASMCLYCARNDMVHGETIQERLKSVVNVASFVRPLIPPARDIEDPFGKEFPVFRAAAEQTNKALWLMLDSMRKYYVDARPIDAAPVAKA
ncbi:MULTISPECIES: low molecular weight phosphatase family protein [unclassified Bifidobacterium]|uniref:arsenate reductase/protein-tyrosine-phosphatase family protein n=1 Tax=unclassified Bifidobacterium TaxID=2608897 RepID=UPI00112DAC0F|nr:MULTISPECIES: low molecular weight phosphatase family protein [unclassified Bifidobacterium]TPF78589.1 protein tyrosine phosphatase [Bifidobacterium sp. UTCIF-1]TPF80870.1 protein tyrosine phosphatase [Bifidobacterium sp. UTCIF-24]TPF82691.1 protein tyrosine phosphatase [Bifidobacterium sp. UTCIF-3]TPF84535.1 protein tyrosine phosphatase [Bifidobacterium sp. UTCIF-36]TPF90904.1 protein tyrosine phosphatase [Bifidobacterium sp. UTBIF-56]